jgi:hypothetical protein
MWIATKRNTGIGTWMRFIYNFKAAKILKMAISRKYQMNRIAKINVADICYCLKSIFYIGKSYPA